jgi:hypothetical protein
MGKSMLISFLPQSFESVLSNIQRVFQLLQNTFFNPKVCQPHADTLFDISFQTYPFLIGNNNPLCKTCLNW